MKLPEQERTEIASALLGSLGPEPEADVEAAWRPGGRVSRRGAGGWGGGDDPLGGDPRRLSGEAE